VFGDACEQRPRQLNLSKCVEGSRGKPPTPTGWVDPVGDFSPPPAPTWLRTEHPERSVWHICHETIYQALYLGRKGGLSRALTANRNVGAEAD
jgi:hypothetical protein